MTKIEEISYAKWLKTTSDNSTSWNFELRLGRAKNSRFVCVCRYGDGVILDSEKSTLNEILGLDLGLGFLLDETRYDYSYLDFHLMRLGGETDYKGSLHGSSEGYGSYVSTTLNAVIDTDVTYMYHYILSDSLEVSCGLGLGYRYWER
ncbi:MAG: hypothetical protein WBK95_04165 [Sulfurimonas sp.]